MAGWLGRKEMREWLLSELVLLAPLMRRESREKILFSWGREEGRGSAKMRRGRERNCLA